jgi:hypothetical protein
MKTINLTPTIEDIKETFRKLWERTPEKDRHFNACGIAAAQLAGKWYDAIKEPENYKELYCFIYEYVCGKNK